MYRTISESGEFESAWYRSQLSFPSSLFDPIWHYLRRGWLEGLNPSPRFDTGFYLRWNKDVREAGVNPFDHYLRYGKKEGRPAVLPLAAWRTGELSATEPIRFYNSLSSATPAVSVVVDQETPCRWPGDIATLMAASAFIAHHLGRPLRILVREGAPALPHIDSSSIVWPAGLAIPSVTRIPAGHEYSDIEKHPKDVFVSTSWSSTHILREAQGAHPLVYLILADEADRLGTGEARELAHSVLQSEAITYVCPGDLARRLWPGKKRPASVIESDSLLLPTLGRYQESRPTDRNIVVWGGHDLNASYTRLALTAIERVIQGGHLDPIHTPVVVAGELREPLLLLGTHQVHSCGYSSIAAVHAALSRSQVLIALGGSHGLPQPLAHYARSQGVSVVDGAEGSLSVESVAASIETELKSKRKAKPAQVKVDVGRELEKLGQAVGKRLQV